MNKKSIETISVNAVRDSIVMTDLLDQYIPDNDKEPFWDGAVYIYTNKEHKKEHFKGRMPVQVKGTENNDLSQSEITFTISTTDLNGYLIEGGTIFFVVYIANSGLAKKIYYVELTPIKIRMILDSVKSQKTKNIKLKEFPVDNIQKTNIFLNCLQNCQKQSSFFDKHLFSLEELKEKGVLENITIPISGVNIQKDPQMALINSDVYVYANIKGCPIPQPLKMLPIDIHTQEEIEVNITIDGKEYYNTAKVIKSAEETKYLFGESLFLTFSHKIEGVKVNYKNSDDVRVIAKDLDFMLSYIEKGYFEINGHKFPFEDENADYSKFNIEEQKAILEFAQKALKVLNILRCDKKLLISSLTDEDYRNVYRLYTAFVDKQPVKGLNEDLSVISLMKVGNLNLVVALHKIENEPGTYKIEDLFESKMLVTFKGENDERIPISPYVLFKSEDFIKIDNIKWEALLPSFVDVCKDKESFGIANRFMLNLLDAYDKCSKKVILDTAKEFAEWLLTVPDSTNQNGFGVLNLLQIVKRIRTLDDAENKQLYKIIAEKDTPYIAMVGAYLLLDQQALAEIYFDKMKPDEQEEFIKFPIYRFWKKPEDQTNDQSQNAHP